MRRLSASRPLLSSVASGLPRWWPPALARRRDAPVVAAPNPPALRVFRFPHGSRNMANSSGVQGVESIYRYGRGRPAGGEEDRERVDMDIIFGDKYTRTNLEVTDGKRDRWMAEVEATNDDEDASNAAEDVIVLCSDRNASENARNQSMSKVSEDEAHASLVSEEELSCYDEGDSADFDCSAEILPDSSHRDGSIYKGTYKWQRDYRIADRNETRLEAMMLSEPKDCMMHNGICLWHSPTHMMQIFSIKLAKTPVDSGPVELYGYIAMRDRLDPLSNFVINLSRDDPMIIEQGSLIEMTGPKRGIDFFDTILIEYDMRIKQGEQEKDDLQLIDGATAMDELTLQTRHVFTQRIHGDCGAIDISLSRLVGAVEATVEVVISEVQCAIDLCLSCFASGLNEEIRLFHGAIGEPRALRRSVVAVVMDSWMHLKFKVGSVDHSGYVEPCCSFKPTNHGCSRQEIRSKFTSMSVKVTWSTLDLRGE